MEDEEDEPFRSTLEIAIRMSLEQGDEDSAPTAATLAGDDASSVALPSANVSTSAKLVY